MADTKPEKECADGGERIPSFVATGIVCVLLGWLATASITSMREKSVTVDEIMYIAAGHYHLSTGDFYMNMTNPPLMKMLSAFPLLFLRVGAPAIDGAVRDWSLIEQWKYSRVFLYGSSVDADRILFWARIPTVCLAVLLGWLVFSWSRGLFGVSAGLASLVLYCFSPNILAHARLATLDLGLATFMFAATYAFWGYMRNNSTRMLLLCGFLCGLALLTKTTAVFLAPVFAAFVVVCVIRGNGYGILSSWPLVRVIAAQRVRTRQLASAIVACVTISVIVLATLNAGYGFSGSFLPLDVDGDARFAGRLPAWVAWLIGKALSFPQLVPEPFLELLRFQGQLTSATGGTYFWGHVYESGIWYSMMASMLLKTPVPGVLLVVAAGSVLFARRTGEVGKWLLAAAIGTVLFVFSYFYNINVGLRYVLPAYPFMHIVGGSFWHAAPFRRRSIRVIGFALIMWYATCSMRVHPDYLAYFNEIAGGPANGHRVLVDSNLDWGQDLKALKHYMDERGIERIKLAYFGSADARYYGIDYDYLPSVGLAPRLSGERWWYEVSEDAPFVIEPTRGRIAASATLVAAPGWLRGLFGDGYGWLRELEPVDQVGHSILIYDIE